MKNKNIKLWWSSSPKPGNFGDILSPFILREMGYTVTEVNRNSSGKFMCIGSTAKFIKPDDIVWGTGIMRNSDPIEKNAKYLAVRGPLTGAKVGCDIYGDPGLLCSHFWPLEKKETKRLGFIPHYVDYKKYDVGGNDQINLLNSNPIEVMKHVVKYDSIISSSLHGIIVAHSYGIPAGWWQPSNKLDGDGSKFEDYARSVDIELKPSKNYKNVVMTLPTKEKIKQIQGRLLNAITRTLR
jgi:hypothetical protein